MAEAKAKKAKKDDEVAIPEPLHPPPVDLSDGIEPFARAVIQSNQQEFLRAARSQRFAFATMKWLFLVVFLIALGAMIAADSFETFVLICHFLSVAHIGLDTNLGSAKIRQYEI